MSDRASQRQDDTQSRIAALEAELSQLRAERDRAEHEREQYRKLYTLVLYELERLKRQLFGKKAETVDAAQVQLAFGPVLDALARAESGAEDAQEDVQAELQKLRDAAERARVGPKSPESLAVALLERIASGADVPAELLRLVGRTMASEAQQILDSGPHALDRAATWALGVRTRLEAARLLASKPGA
ncbi:MAG TPA: hypothetical protein VK524_04555 [Polyangiaceae bacterium]|nr:hypothetical protein [Polyangiaceae bacterium]